MGRGKRFLMDALPLALTGVILRALAVSFNAYVSKKLGAEAMGLYGLVMSVGTFGIVLASSGINLATVRLTAAASESGGPDKLRSIMRKCALYALIFGVAASALLLSFAGILGRRVLSDGRVIPALRAFALSLPAVSLSAAMAGYFTGTRKIGRSVISLAFDQLLRVVCIIVSLIIFEGRGMASACLAPVCGNVTADWLSLSAAYGLCRGAMRRGTRRGSCAVPGTAPAPGAPERRSVSPGRETSSPTYAPRSSERAGGAFGAKRTEGTSRAGAPRRPLCGGGARPGSCARMRAVPARAAARAGGGAGAPPLPGDCGDGGRRRRNAAASLRDVAAIAVPVAVGAYLRTGLTSLEHIAIPWGLRRSGISPDKALAAYGTVSQMALPVILFPYAVIGAFTSLLVPEMTALAERGDSRGVQDTARRVISLTIFFGVAVAGAFSLFGRSIGNSLYNSADAGNMIRSLAPVMPVMFLDTAVDSMLKGLGEQVYCAKVNTVDAALCLASVLVAVPGFGIAGYIAVIYASEALNASLSISRLVRITSLHPKLSDLAALVLAPTGALFSASLVCRTASAAFAIPPSIAVILYSAVYLASGGAILFAQKKRPVRGRSA